MNRDRILGIILFSVSASIVWFGFLFFIGVEKNNPLIWSGFFSAVLSTGTIAYLQAPSILKHKKSNKLAPIFFHGVLVTFLSFVLGSILFALTTTVSSFFLNPGMVINYQSIEGMVLTGIVGFFISIVYMSPGFIVGGFTAIFYIEAVSIIDKTNNS